MIVGYCYEILLFSENTFTIRYCITAWSARLLRQNSINWKKEKTTRAL